MSADLTDSGIFHNSPYRRDLPPLPSPHGLAVAVSRAAIEVTMQARDLSLIARWVNEDVLAQIALEKSLMQRAGKRLTGQVRIPHLNLCRVNADVAEAGIVSVLAEEVFRIALRFQVERRRWRTTVLEII